MIDELPLYFHPTDILLVDDDVNYSKNVEVILLNHGISVCIFNDPKNALEFVSNKSSTSSTDKLFHVEEPYLNKAIFNIDFSMIHQEVYNKDRFHNMSVLIVDYAMPGLNGKEFFEQIRSLPIKKILLTGEADYETAVQMFNRGLIDRFFLKSDEQLFEELFTEIAQLKIQFFQKMSSSILSALGTKLLPFNDPVFIEFFLEVLKQNDTVEYYALDKSGSYLLINKNGQPTILNVKSEEDMQVIYELAEGEETIAETTLEDLKNKKKLPYFHEGNDINAPVDSWLLYDAQCLMGSTQPYYYALIKDTQILQHNKS